MAGQYAEIKQFAWTPVGSSDTTLYTGAAGVLVSIKSILIHGNPIGGVGEVLEIWVVPPAGSKDDTNRLFREEIDSGETRELLLNPIEFADDFTIIATTTTDQGVNILIGGATIEAL